MPSLQVVATDVSNDALDVARENAGLNDVDDQIEFLCGDLFEAIKARNSKPVFDLVISNPPYISTDEIDGLPGEIKEHEPVGALDGGEDGLDVISRIVEGTPCHLKSGGWLLLEIGSTQAEEVMQLVSSNGKFDDPEIRKDLAGMDRVIMTRVR